MISLTPICPVCGSAPNADGSHVCRVPQSAGLKTIGQLTAERALQRVADAKAVMIFAHNTMVEWYVQDQADVIGTIGATNAAHREVEAVKLIDAWLGKCPRMLTEAGK